MTPLRILILEAQVPFVHGGAEILVRELEAALVARGHAAQVVSVPFTDHPKDEILAGAEAWRVFGIGGTGRCSARRCRTTMKSSQRRSFRARTA